MRAAVVKNFSLAPQYEDDYANPLPKKDEVLIHVTASALSNRARSDANGSHYAAEDRLPMIPGVDGVGVLPNGNKVFFVSNGSFAEQVAVASGHWVTMANELKDEKIAGMMNPALSSWLALQYRANFKKGQKVLILGATGNAGSMAVQIAKRLGAASIVAVGRNTRQLAELQRLGATQTIALGADVKAYQKELAQAGQDVDIVLDYLWGDVTAHAMQAIIPNRLYDEQELKWVEIGSSAGQTAPIPGAAFRAVKLQLIGSGQGSVGVQAILKSFEEILQAEQKSPFEFNVRAVMLSQIESVWDKQSGERFVFLPHA
ncbi:zinc-binding alcohol dehydrogenase family protein [uncultured Leuconostoc sp.]|uniref:quinone oxidoreductase family protein n=1 Tax=uncultured Leuconostoc sp. TaxID=173262 RepID=UPI0025F48E0F|nr:zinc-binding alcohol dehydrogenase family protein [uncultured Leuconostoc sp.]